MAVYSRFLNIARVTLAVSVLPVVSVLCAQGSIETAFSALKPGQRVRLRAQGGDRTESRVLSVRTESPALWLEGASAPYDGATIDSLWVRGRATAAGAIVGAVVFGAATSGAGLAICKGLSESSSSCGSDTTVPLFLAGAAGGALIGALIGTGIPKWRLRYTRGLPVRSAVRSLPQGRLGFGIAYTVGW